MRHQNRIAFITGLCLLLALLAMPMRAQVERESPLHAVAYFDVAPAGVEATRSQLNRYRDASKEEPGYIDIEWLEQLNQLGRFAVLETWRDAAAFEAHGSSSASTKLQQALQAVRIGSYDQRPYRSISSTRGAEQTIAAQSLVVVTHVDIGGGSSRNAESLLQDFATRTRLDNGNMGCEIWQGATRSNHFTLISLWSDTNAYTAHRVARYTRQFHEAIEPLTGSPLDERLYKISN